MISAMPFTPLHMGPALLLGPLLARHVNLLMFALAQVWMDLEVLVRLMLNSDHLHGWSNTALGAVGVLLLCLWPGMALCRWVVRLWNRHLNAAQVHFMVLDPHPSRWALFNGAMLGVSSHVLLDALMHPDAQPFWPLLTGNPLLGVISVDALNRGCLLLLVLGIVMMTAWCLGRGLRSMYKAD